MRDPGGASVDGWDLRRVPRLAGLSPEARQWVARRAALRSVPAEALVFREGEACTRFWLLLEGAVKVCKLLESGRELILGVFHRGQAIGEVALIDGEGYPASARALEDSTLLTLDRDDYLTLLRTFPEAPLSFIRDLTMRMRTLSRRVQDLGGGGVEYRLARVFLALGRRAGHPVAGGIRIPLLLTRQELADMVGARVETTIRLLSKWRKSGLLVTDDEGFLLCDADQLQRITWGC